MSHRGPDDSGRETLEVEGAGRLELGTVRLAILDLSPAGHMPMTSTDGRYVISYNGEITNYLEVRAELETLGCTFRSHTDTEVLLNAWALWGSESLSRFEGMFAFAIADRQSRTLTLARDAFGIKPLFYAAAPDRSFAFASELPILLDLRHERAHIDWQTAYDYLRWGSYDISSRSFVAGVSQLAPGHTLTVDLTTGAVGEPRRYWWPSVDTDRIKVDDAADAVRELFLASVRQNLRSDVPLGVALSGGIDSSAIACAVRLLEPDLPLRTFSFVAPGFAQSEDRWIDMVVGATNAEPHYITASGADLRRDLDSLIRAQGEPFGSTSIYAQFKVFEAVREQGVIVTLDGQGADEAFAGYAGYPAQRLHSMLERGQVGDARRFVGAWAEWPDRDPAGLLASGAALMVPESLRRRVAETRRAPHPLFDEAALRERGVRLGFPALGEESQRGSRLKAHLRAELTSRGLPALLRHGDRSSMHFSVESRVPFLSRALVEYTLRLPEDQLVDAAGASKSILRRALRGLVPDAILDRRDKIGFVTPENDWLGEVSSADSDPLSGLLAAGSDGRPIADARQSDLGPRERWRILNLRRWVEAFEIATD
jgi:asparagine synthase (glutamine-hydrolysing)